MKTLIVLAVILGVLFLYFVATAEKSLIVKGRELVPAGINIPKLIIDKVKQVKSLVAGEKDIKAIGDSVIADIADSGLASVIDGAIDSTTNSFIDSIIANAKDLAKGLVSGTIDKIGEAIKSPIENKVDEVLCPQEQK